MKSAFAPALLAVLFLVANPSIAAEKVCINNSDIVSSQPEKDGAAILFRMRDGVQWRNILRNKCPDLVFNGFTWTVRNPDNTVCENEQSLKVLRSGEICVLGKFEKITSTQK